MHYAVKTLLYGLLSLLISILAACGASAPTAATTPTTPTPTTLNQNVLDDAYLSAEVIARQTTDNTVLTLAAYAGDPDDGGTLLASTDVTIGTDNLRQALHDLVRNNEGTTHLKITLGSESFSLDITDKEKPNRPSHGKPGKGHHKGGEVGTFIRNVADGTTVTITLYDGDPASGGTQLAQSSAVKGTDDIKEALHDLLESNKSATHLTLNADSETLSVELPGPSYHELLRSLAEGTAITVTLYDGDPDDGGSAIDGASTTLTITDSAKEAHRAIHELIRNNSSATHITVSASSGESGTYSIRGKKHR